MEVALQKRRQGTELVDLIFGEKDTVNCSDEKRDVQR